MNKRTITVTYEIDVTFTSDDLKEGQTLQDIKPEAAVEFAMQRLRDGDGPTSVDDCAPFESLSVNDA